MYNKDELSLLPVDSHNVTKNQTGHRMHVEGPQMWQINRWSTIAFRIYMVCMVWYVWYGMRQLTVLPGKSTLCKKHLIFAYFGGHESELPDFGRTWTPNC